MTPESLLIQRYKVIAPYPRSTYTVGEVVTVGQMGKETQVKYFEYPHLFQPLPWYAERKKSEMPEFIKCDERVWKITEWDIDLFGRFFPVNKVDVEGETENFANIKWHFSKEKFVPCTLEEYNEWKQSNK